MRLYFTSLSLLLCYSTFVSQYLDFYLSPPVFPARRRRIYPSIPFLPHLSSVHTSYSNHFQHTPNASNLTAHTKTLKIMFPICMTVFAISHSYLRSRRIYPSNPPPTNPPRKHLHPYTNSKLHIQCQCMRHDTQVRRRKNSTAPMLCTV
jgi:hypothetical protein